jgi:hypothetical protein
LANGLVDVVARTSNRFFEPSDVLVEALARSTRRDQRSAILLHGEHFNELPSAHDHRLQLPGLGIERRSYFDWHLLAEHRENPSIDLVCLSQLAHSTSEVPHLSRIHDGNRMPGVPQHSRHNGLVPAGRLKDDQRRLDLTQSLKEL